MIDYMYKNLLTTVLEHGVDKEDRTGIGTKSLFGCSISHDMRHGFPLLTCKKLSFRNVASELEWFLSGQTSALLLYRFKNYIWLSDTYTKYKKIMPEIIQQLRNEGIMISAFDIVTEKEYLIILKTNVSEILKKFNILLNPITDYKNLLRTFASVIGYFSKRGTSSTSLIRCSESLLKNLIQVFFSIFDLGPIYGYQWYKQMPRIHHLLSTNPLSRKMHVSAWDYDKLDEMTLEPCHTSFTLYTRELSQPEKEKHGLDKKYALSLKWEQRSCDLFLGLPYNIASYGLLLSKLAKQYNMVPEHLQGTITDAHIYNNHIDAVQELLEADIHSLPELIWNDSDPELHVPFFLSSKYEPTFQYPTWSPITLEMIPQLDLFGYTLENYVSSPAISAPLNTQTI